MSDIEGVRPRLEDRGFDLPITMPVALLLVFALGRFTRWIGNRFETDEWVAWVVATLVGSFIIPAAAVAIGSAWAMAVEIVRLGNEHVGHRARMDALRANFVVVFGIGMAAVWIGSAITAIRKRADLSRGQATSAHAE